MSAPTTQEPMLGMPEATLRELASVDFHAGHPDVDHPSQPHPNPAIPPACACAEPAVIGDFAMRLLTGQAQFSTTRDGKGVVMATHHYDGQRPRGIKVGDTTQPVLAGLVVHGNVESTDHAPDCTNDEPHDCFQISVQGVGVLGHRQLDDDDVVLLLVDQLHEFTSRRPQRPSDAAGES